MLANTEVITPRGNPATVITREGTSDLSLAGGFFSLWGKIDDEYRLGDLHVSGVFVDVGAHIGLVTLSVLLDNPDARAICVEPLSENLDLLSRNMDANGVSSRVQMVEGAIASGETVGIPYDLPEDHEFAAERYIGGLQSSKFTNTAVATVPAYTLGRLVEMAGGSIDVLKLDCEGCEWEALADPAVARVGTIIGEWHGHPLGQKVNGVTTLKRRLTKTHKVESLADKGGTGTFRAVRRG